MSGFNVVCKDGNARAGVLQTAHGKIETPVFMPVGTQGTVKALTPEDLTTLGTQIILGNTYHLYLRPGHKLIKKIGGLHKFMNWNGPILIDSGGFQAFSLGAMIEHGVKKMGNEELRIKNKELRIRKKTAREIEEEKDQSLARSPLVARMTEEGVEFVSHLDGTKHLLTPELSVEIQLDVGSDIILAMDELLSPVHDRDYARKSLDRTHRWELRSKTYFDKHLKGSTNPDSQFFGILQGVYDQEIREAEAKWITQQDFAGVSIGGSFGTSEHYGREEVDWASAKAINQTMDWVIPLLPTEWPRHALGIGEVQNIFDCIERGIDMFDCVAPMRRARNGSLYIGPKSGGRMANKYVLSISRAEFKADQKPIDSGCNCYTCQNYSKAYLRHLFLAKELLYFHLATIHNVFFIVNLVKIIRTSILDHKFSSLKRKWCI